jgi:methylthioribulose-1-phosphate dehydratase
MNLLDTRLEFAAEELIKLGAFFASHNMVPASSGNFSYRIDSSTVAVTISGKDKGSLTPSDIMLVDMHGRSLGSSYKPSAEVLLHTQLYNWSDKHGKEINVICHVHSSKAVALSKHYAKVGRLILNDYELLKAFRGVTSHLHTESVPIFPNTQNIPELAKAVDEYLKFENQNSHGYLIVGHGLYSWGATADEARRHIEAYEALFESHIIHSQFKGI